MKQEDWIKDLQERMADHREPVKDDLWAGIEQALDQRRVVEKTTFMMTWRRYVAAAAVVMALLGGAGYVLFLQQEPQSTRTTRTIYRQQMARQAAPARQEPVATAADKPIQQLVANVKKVLVGGSGDSEHGQKQLAMLQKDVVHDVSASLNGATQNHKQAATQDKEQSSTDTHQPSNEQQHRKTAQSTTQPMAVPEPAVRVYTPSRSRQQAVSMNVYAVNSLGSYSAVNGLFPSAVMAKGFYMNTASSELLYAAAPSPMVAQTHEETQHHKPVSLGLSAGYAISDRWTLTSGVVYTKLSSDFIQVLGDSRLTRQQTLHYVGVPLNVSYTVWGNDKLKTYVVAGGQVDFNVDAKTVKEHVEYDTPKDKVQFSAQAGLGLQYNFMPQLGAYVEPGVKYYIDNKSETKNFFKDKPLNMNLEVGVRWNLK